MKKQFCRICDHALDKVFIDLGMSPLANSYIQSSQLQQMEPMYPLKTYVCSNCFLVQVQEFETPQHIFGDYAYFSSFSDTWLHHCKVFADMAISRFDLNKDKRVIEIASNDGYMLQFFQEHKINVLGIEPAANVAEVAIQKGIPTKVEFMSSSLAQSLASQDIKADLVIGNNVLAHVPELNDFVEGIKLLLKDEGIVSMEFPHLMQLMKYVQFDTIYHEHYSYFSFETVYNLFEAHGLQVFDVDLLPTHGGSLRIYARLMENNKHKIKSSVHELRDQEKEFGLNDLTKYSVFKEEVKSIRFNLLQFLINLKTDGKRVACYGAPAKGNTLLNYCGLDTDFLEYTVDRSPYKQNCFLPGSRIPIYSPDFLKVSKPDYLLILPWNLREEIITQTTFIRE